MTEHPIPRDEIRITGLHVRACHGVMEHERFVPQTFVIDAAATLDLFTPSLSDELEHTVNYDGIAETIVNVVQGQPLNLIEHLAGTIADEVMGRFEAIYEIRITVHKPHAPLEYLVNDVSVTVHRSRCQFNKRYW